MRRAAAARWRLLFCQNLEGGNCPPSATPLRTCKKEVWMTVKGNGTCPLEYYYVITYKIDGTQDSCQPGLIFSICVGVKISRSL